MPVFGCRILRIALSGLLTAFALGVPAFAQTELPLPTPLPVPMPPAPELPTVPIPEAPLVPLNTPSTDILTAAPGLPPLPGSVADNYEQELRDREKFTTTTWRGGTIREFP